ncbi:hypothetical protein BBI17_008812 [Phytophthora kernoviae]|uniref:RxLR effector protein n=1 Tax=Phytophthora kernoviae TaxID=325452 RepID=A0A3R7GC01_9STRA|nr:hypothetical protein BBI17_008812 [Phytophthora kernoviae]
MRPSSFLLLVLAIIFACSNAVLADSPADARALNVVSNERGAKRSLRTMNEESNEVDSTDEADGTEEEDRILFMGRLKNKWDLRSMRKAADKDFKKQAKALEKLDKAAKKQQKQIDGMIKRGYRPEKIAAKLGLNKLADPATSNAWPFYQAFLKSYTDAKALRKVNSLPS